MTEQSGTKYSNGPLFCWPFRSHVLICFFRAWWWDVWLQSQRAGQRPGGKPSSGSSKLLFTWAQSAAPLLLLAAPRSDHFLHGCQWWMEHAAGNAPHARTHATLESGILWMLWPGRSPEDEVPGTTKTNWVVSPHSCESVEKVLGSG